MRRGPGLSDDGFHLGVVECVICVIMPTRGEPFPEEHAFDGIFFGKLLEGNFYASIFDGHGVFSAFGVVPWPGSGMGGSIVAKFCEDDGLFVLFCILPKRGEDGLPGFFEGGFVWVGLFGQWKIGLDTDVVEFVPKSHFLVDIPVGRVCDFSAIDCADSFDDIVPFFGAVKCFSVFDADGEEICLAFFCHFGLDDDPVFVVAKEALPSGFCLERNGTAPGEF